MFLLSRVCVKVHVEKFQHKMTINYNHNSRSNNDDNQKPTFIIIIIISVMSSELNDKLKDKLNRFCVRIKCNDTKENREKK